MSDSVFPQPPGELAAKLQDQERARFPGSAGLTKRELFAALIMQGLLVHVRPEDTPGRLAQAAVNGAEALIAELAKNKGETP